jgi:hypothetical protein
VNYSKIIKKASLLSVLAVSAMLPTIASAAENPMDHVGAQHNMYLSCLLETGDSAANSLVRLVETCGYDPGMPLEEFVKTYQPVLEISPLVTIAKKMSSQRDRFTAYEFSFFERMDAVAVQAKDMAHAEALFAELEAESVERLDANSDSGAIVLGSLSVARHSTRFWSKYDAEPAGHFVSKRMRWWKWLIVAAADVGGYALTKDIGTAASASETAYDLLNR